MAVPARIQWAMQSLGCQDPWTRIICVGGVNPDGSRWRQSQAEMIINIESGVWDFSVGEPGKSHKVVVASYNNAKYIKAETDGAQPESLMSLPES